MVDHIVDTNVLLCASTADPQSRFEGTDHVPADQLSMVLDWIMAFRSDSNRLLVLDRAMRLFDEYKRNLRGDPNNNIGMLVISEKMATCRFVHVPQKKGEDALPDSLGKAFNYRGDRKLVALAFADSPKSKIVNACDTDWYDWESILTDHGIVVEQVIDGWNRKYWEQMMKNKKRSRS